MKLPQTQTVAPRVIWFDEVLSTNTVLREMVESRPDADVPHGTLVVTDKQLAGRGRQGRDWVTPAGLALATSVLIRDFYEPEPTKSDRLPPSWLPLLAGSAMAAALQPFFRLTGTTNVHSADAHNVQTASSNSSQSTGTNCVQSTTSPKRVGVKWPNDVHVRDEHDAEQGSPGLKLSGILCEVTSDGAVIVGAGVNVLLEDWQLPTERSASLLTAGADLGDAASFADEHGARIADDLLARYVSELLGLVDLARTDPQRARNRVLRDSLTLGTEVRVHLPGSAGVVDGRAVALDDTGALLVDRPTTGQLVVNAADIEHLR